MFEPVKDKYRYVMDPETGAVMFVKGTSQIETLSVFFRAPHEPEVEFDVLRDRQFPDRPHVPNDRSNPMIKLLVGGFKRAFDARPRSYEENSKFVRYLLSGLAAINREWPLCGTPFFYSDLDYYEGRENPFPFSFPSNEEIAKL